VIDEHVTRHVARLARLRLTEPELARMQAELSAILTHIEQIQELDLDGVPPTTHVIPMENVFREDAPTPSIPVELALREAPEVHGGGFAVPRMG
jgi:aspartyl-tRNA(Asn)/glutamyl-tRNA(Gln) amidotransferase subunit C